MVGSCYLNEPVESIVFVSGLILSLTRNKSKGEEYSHYCNIIHKIELIVQLVFLKNPRLAFRGEDFIFIGFF